MISIRKKKGFTNCTHQMKRISVSISKIFISNRFVDFVYCVGSMYMERIFLRNHHFASPSRTCPVFYNHVTSVCEIIERYKLLSIRDDLTFAGYWPLNAFVSINLYPQKRASFHKSSMHLVRDHPTTHIQIMHFITSGMIFVWAVGTKRTPRN